MKNQEYQKTLNLPQTEFSMKAGLIQKEPQLLEKWQKEGLYQAIREQAKGKKKFILHDGPPYANGHIHIGHALNKTLKDLIVKFRTMQGYDAWYIPGWDCHGLPIEHQLFKELKQNKHEVNCVEFRQKAHDYAMKFVEIQKQEFKRLGIFGQWDDPYLTLDPQYEYWILKSLAELNKKGYLYRGQKPVNWCTHCETALAEAEVEYEDHTSPSVYVKFKVKNPGAIDEGFKKDLYLVIWTTTPWTLLANVAVAVHSAFRYVFVETPNEILVIEKSLAPKVLEKAGIQEFKIIKDLEGQHLTPFLYEHPFGMKEDCVVVCADYVTKEDGTGLVHTAPGHGQDDFETGVKYGLDVLMPVDNKGVYTEKAGSYRGQYVFKANPKIVEDLKNKGVLLASQNLQHSYPHCWRCKSPIIFRATYQWFLKIDHDNLRGRLKEVIKTKIQWIPEAGQERIAAMVNLRPDWCISRQRYWGVPIPAIKPKAKDIEPQLFTEVIEQFAEVVRKEGSSAWFEKDVKEFLPKGFRWPQGTENEFEKTFDILDVWFDSGVSHQAVVKAKMGLPLPIDLYLEGSDQHRGWFQSSLIPAVAIEGKAPYKGVLTHGFVVDGEGRKMSKSLGNVVAPQDIINQSGADILRLWIASSLYSEDIRISKEIMERLVDAYRKIRNTFRYILGNLNEFNPDSDCVDFSKMTLIDQWALSQLAVTMDKVTQAYETYEFSRVYKLIYGFCNEELSSFYLDILKDRLYTSAKKSHQRRSAQSVLYYILNHLVRAIAPILCFTAEEIFQFMPKDKSVADIKSVHLLSWLEVPENWRGSSVLPALEVLVKLRPYVLKALEDKRREAAIGSSLEAKVVLKTASDRDYAYLSKYQDQLSGTFIVSQVEVQRVSQVRSGLSEEFAQTEVVIEKAQGQKCERCWNYKTDVGGDQIHPTLCARCTEIVKEF